MPLKCHQKVWNTISGSPGCERVVVVVLAWGSIARPSAAH